MTPIARPDPRLPAARPAAARILYVLREYPRLGQTYIKNEIEALENQYEIGIVTRSRAEIGYANHRPDGFAAEMEELVAQVEHFRPDVLHTHHLTELALIGELSRRTGVPFTVRTHSCDTIGLRRPGLTDRIRQMMRREQPASRAPWFTAGLLAMESELCLGVLAFPCARPWMVRAGVNPAKLIDCFPVVRFAAFHDRSPNGDAIMNVGAPAPDKATPDFLRLARKVPDRRFDLYAMGAETEWLQRRSEEIGARINIIGPVEPEAMPSEYKKHRWLVYTGDMSAPAAGWPMVIAEAQAAGVGVCMPALRPDLVRYVGEGAGILYESIDELPAIVSGPVPDEMRERGFEQARKSDIESHKHLLTDLWDDALAGRAPDLHPRAAWEAEPAFRAPPSAPATLLAASAVSHA